METIAAAAIVFDDVVWSLPAPHRHYHIIEKHFKETGKNGSGKQGFVTSAGRFVDRYQAASLAYDAKQIEATRLQLFTEDLW